MSRSILLFMITFLLALLYGCQTKTSPIHDVNTKDQLEIAEQKPEYLTVKILNDAMLGTINYANRKLAVDPKYYENNEIKRGDIIYISSPKEFFSEGRPTTQLLRIVGLSGERIRMYKGQLYIDGKKLISFYGNDMNNNLKKLKKELKDPDLENFQIENLKNRINYVEKEENLEEQVIPDGQYFLLGDNRMFAIDSRMFGPISKNEIIGKLIGELK